MKQVSSFLLIVVGFGLAVSHPVLARGVPSIKWAETPPDTIVVSSDTVADPIAVRYAFDNAAVPSLFNKEGLPASSFRTDD